jgi:hypothetical protein
VIAGVGHVLTFAGIRRAGARKLLAEPQRRPQQSLGFLEAMRFDQQHPQAVLAPRQVAARGAVRRDVVVQRVE